MSFGLILTLKSLTANIPSLESRVRPPQHVLAAAAARLLPWAIHTGWQNLPHVDVSAGVHRAFMYSEGAPSTCLRTTLTPCSIGRHAMSPLSERDVRPHGGAAATARRRRGGG